MDSVNNLLLDESIRHQIALQGYSAGVVRRIMAVLNRSDKRLAAELAVLLESMSPTTFQMERLESLLSSVRSLSTAAYNQMGKDLSAELREFVAYEVSYQHQMLVSHVPVAVHVAAVSAKSVYASCAGPAVSRRTAQERVERSRCAEVQEGAPVDRAGLCRGQDY